MLFQLFRRSSSKASHYPRRGSERPEKIFAHFRKAKAQKIFYRENRLLHVYLHFIVKLGEPRRQTDIRVLKYNFLRGGQLISASWLKLCAMQNFGSMPDQLTENFVTFPCFSPK